MPVVVTIMVSSYQKSIWERAVIITYVASWIFEVFYKSRNKLLVTNNSIGKLLEFLSYGDELGKMQIFDFAIPSLFLNYFAY